MYDLSIQIHNQFSKHIFVSLVKQLWLIESLILPVVQLMNENRLEVMNNSLVKSDHTKPNQYAGVKLITEIQHQTFDHRRHLVLNHSKIVQFFSPFLKIEIPLTCITV